MAPELVLALQGIALLYFVVKTSITVVLSLPAALLQCWWSSSAQGALSDESTGCVFYEGSVWHERTRPVHNTFRYVDSPISLYGGRPGHRGCWRCRQLGLRLTIL